jgi:H+/Cl- antiporter ClcA
VALFDASLDAAPAGVVIAVVVAVRFRSGWPLLMAPLGGVIGGLLGRVAWEWFATKQVGFDFGSEFEGYDWVLGFASVGVLVGAVLGTALAVKRARRWPAR